MKTWSLRIILAAMMLGVAPHVLAEDPAETKTPIQRPDPDKCPACAMGMTAEQVFKRLDVNEDRLVSGEEFTRSPGMQDPEKARETVNKLDADQDGRLTWKEFETAFLARHANCKKRSPQTQTERVGGSDGRGDGSRFARVFMLRSDANEDGKIDADEFRGGAAGFRRLDKNNNGFIEPDELGDLHQRRLDDPLSMRERLAQGKAPVPPSKPDPATPVRVEE